MFYKYIQQSVVVPVGDRTADAAEQFHLASLSDFPDNFEHDGCHGQKIAPKGH